MRIDEALEEITRELGAAPASALAAVRGALARWWETTAQAADAGSDAVVVRSLVAAELVVVAADTRVASELRYRRDELVACLRALALDEPVRRVRIVLASDR